MANKNFLVYCLVGVLKMFPEHARCSHLDSLESIMAACDASMFDEVPANITRLLAHIVKRWWSSYGLPYVTEAFLIEPEVKFFIPVSRRSCVSHLFMFGLWCREKAVAKMHLELLRTLPVLHHVWVTTISHHEGTPRPIGALLEVKATVLLMILPRVTRNLPTAAAMRCDEGLSVLRCNRRFGLIGF
jgi:hypothetical protein